MARKVTILDIAQRSNASTTTVSMVLRGKPGIGDDTRQRVLDVAQELGYQRRTPVGTTDTDALTVAMFVRSRSRQTGEPLPSVNPFYSWVMTGVESAARPFEMNLLYATLPVDHDNRLFAVPQHLLSQPSDGTLLIGSFSAESVDRIVMSRPGPLVIVDGPATASRHDAVVSDNEGGAYDAVCHLIDRGHRTIALVGPDPDVDPNFDQRRTGYQRAMAEHGLRDIQVQTGVLGEREAGAHIVASLRAEPAITALFACNDSFAIEAIRAVRDVGRSVPDDVSVIGFDDIALASQIEPGLTTMAVDKITMGRLAVLMLNHRIAWPAASPALTILRPRLVERGSVRRAASASLDLARAVASDGTQQTTVQLDRTAGADVPTRMEMPVETSGIMAEE